MRGMQSDAIWERIRIFDKKVRKMNLSIEELYTLSKDRELLSSELHPANDYYGHAGILKKYAGIPSKHQIKAAIEHGAFFPHWAWDVDYNSLLPAMLVCGAHRYSVLKEKTNKALFSIGPIIRYAPHFLDDHILSIEKRRMGKTLLVFPHHSTHLVDVHYDIHGYCRRIENIGKEFNTVMVCIYWKDVLRNIPKKYMEHGFECVTAGHMFDPLFLPRLKSIIELATVSTSASFGGGVIPCCIAMGKSHFIIFSEATHTAPDDHCLAWDESPGLTNILVQMKRQVIDAFSEPRSDITPKQIEIANNYWGLSELKAPEEMQLIFQTTEDMWKKGKSFFVPCKDVLTEQALDYLNSNKNNEALFLLEQAISVNPDIPGLKYAEGVVLCRLGRVDEAEKSLTDLLKVVPGHEKGELLLQELKMAKKNQSNLEDKSILNRIEPKKQGLPKLLNLGCGLRYHSDWINIDFHSTKEGVIEHNLNEGIPFEKKSFDVVYHSHLLEHFSKSQALLFLKECFRVLDDSGIIRVVVPDLEQIAKHYLALLEQSLMGDEEAKKQYEWIMLELFDQMIRNDPGGEMLKYWKQDPIPAESFVIQRMGSEVKNILTNIRNNKNRHTENPPKKSHPNPQKIGEFRLSGEIHQWMYDRYSLGTLLQQSGFKDVKVCIASESQIPNFNSYLLDIEPNGSVRKPDSLFMEGVK